VGPGRGGGGAGGAGSHSAGEWTTFAKLGGPGLRKIWGSSDSDIWVVGSYDYAGTVLLDGPAVIPLPRVVHFDGTSWRDADVSGWTEPWYVWGTARDDVWILGAPARHFDGTSWTAFPAADGTSVWGTSQTDVWFGKDPGLLHFDGTAVVAVPTPAIDGVLSMWGFSPSDVWAGGGNPGLMHWDGASWSLVTTNTTLYVLGLWGARPDDVWGVGNGGNRLHWDGAKITGTSEDYTNFEAVIGTAADDVWAVGECCWQNGAEYVGWRSHYDGTSWTSEQVPGVSGITGIWVSPSGRYYAVAGSAILRLAPPDGVDGGADAGDGGDSDASAACASATAGVTAGLAALDADLDGDGGACVTDSDCQLFVPVVDCGPDYRVTGCPTTIASAAGDAARARVADLAASVCGAVAAANACDAQAYLDCVIPWPVCQAGHCVTTHR
jgi:hypothetical protein